MSNAQTLIPSNELPDGTGRFGTDDMHDTAADMARWPLLADKLRLCEEILFSAFNDSDQAALRHQWRHRQFIKFATVFGIAAVLSAIFQLAFPPDILTEDHPMANAEFWTALLAAAAVLLGLLVAFQPRWLLERHKAERLRLAKFRFLIDPNVWCGDMATEICRIDALKAEVAAIRTMTMKQVHDWIEEEMLPEPPSAFAEPRRANEVTDQITDYYRTHRLRFQRDWFQTRAHEHVRFDEITRHLSPVLFFLSVGMVLAHYGYDFVKQAHGLNALSRIAVLLAASLPVIGGGVRTFRSAYEFARNTVRYRSKIVALTTIDGALDSSRDVCGQLSKLWYSELILENEHREWLRLMMEAEWFA